MAQPEKVLAKQQGALEAIGKFGLPVLLNPEAAMEALRMNLGGAETTISFDRVRIPAGGGLAFEVPSEDGEPQSAQEIAGVILDHYPVNAYWAEKFAGQNNPPDCVAMDGRMGAGNPGGPCAKCPNNEWGTDEGGRGKACKNLQRVYLLREGELFPILIALPPTSLKAFREYMRRLTNRLKPFYSVITRVKLQKAQNQAGITYSQATFSKVADLDIQAAASIKEYRQQLLTAMRELEVAAEEYDTSEGPGGSGGVGQAAKDDGEPF